MDKSTRELLGLQDEYFKFDDNWLSYEADKQGANHNVITGKYVRKPSYCKNCGIK